MDEYINGANTPYEPVIKSIRGFLESIDEIDKSREGAIIFFQRKNQQEKDLMMRVYPFKKNIKLLDDQHCGLDNDQRLQIFKKINSPKPYRTFWHFTQFKNYNSSGEHCTSIVPPENIVRYTQNEITFSHKPYEVDGDRITTSWSDFHSAVMNGRIHKNTYEQLLFESDCAGVSFVPIPVLSTPSILLVLNKLDFDGNKNQLLKSLYFRSRNTVDSYLYSRLLDSLFPMLATHGNSWTEKELVQIFVNEICNIILPISYAINDSPPVDYYTEWPSNGFESSYTLPLLDGKYTVNFKLTSFHFVNLDVPNSSPWTWIHSLKVYESNREQSSLLVCKLFKLLHNNWRLINSAEEKAYAKIAEVINHINIKSLKNKVDNMERQFDIINQYRKTLGDRDPKSTLQVGDDYGIVLTVDGFDLINPEDAPGVGQQSGFIYLKHILEQATMNSNKFEVSFETLFSCVEVPKMSRVDMDQDTRKKEAARMLENWGIEIHAVVTNFLKKFKDEIQCCVKERAIPEAASFNENAIFCVKLVRQLNAARFSNYVKDYKVNDCIKRVRAFSDVYQELATSEMQALIDNCDVSMYLEHISNAKYITHRDHARPMDEVRGSFKAMVTVLRKKATRLSGDKLAAMELLLRNLEASGLIQKGKHEPVSQKRYRYDQSDIHDFIKWMF